MFAVVDAQANPPRVLLADDHHLFREGLRGKLEEDGIEVVGDAADGDHAIALTARLEPDLVVTDLSMPGRSGIEVVRRLRSSSPDTGVIILTVSADPSSALDALAAGACGYLLKDTPVDRLVDSIRLAARGQTVVSSSVMRPLIAGIRSSGHGGGSEHQGARAELTAREMEVLKLIAAGADNAAIGRELSISKHTVKRYVTNIFEKLSVGSRVEAAVYAVRAELV
jgi:two-component system NarL family response regulator